MKYIKLFESFEDYDPYELMITPPNDKTEMIFKEIEKHDKANMNLVSDLITLGANLDWQGDGGWTVIHECTYHNHSRILRILIDAGADLNIQDTDGWSALHLCANQNHPEIARMLIDAGADVNIQDNNGNNPLHLASVYRSDDIVDLLLRNGSDPSIKNNDGRSYKEVMGWKQEYN
jgi:ankyrin repeat protein